MRERTPDATRELARGLAGLLADTYLLYTTTQAFHWNVEGPRFHSLHELFERQYTELADAIDTIAERIRAIGFYAPETVDEFVSLSRMQQPRGVRSAESMVERLLEAQRQIGHRVRELQNVADRAMDEATTDLLVERLRVHEKAAWMLQSQLGHGAKELKLARDKERLAS